VPGYHFGGSYRGALSIYTGSGPAQGGEENSDPKIQTKQVLKIF